MNQVSSTSPLQETVLAGILVGLGLALLAPWTARVALGPEANQVLNERGGPSPSTA